MPQEVDFWVFFQVNFVSLGLSFEHIGDDFEYLEVYIVLQRVQFIIIRFSVIVTIDQYSVKYKYDNAFLYLALYWSLVTITENLTNLQLLYICQLWIEPSL